jgi:ATP-dependent helicase/nuclease subunit B
MEEIHSLSDVFSRENFSDAVRRDGRFQLNYRMSGGGLLKVLQQMQQELSNGEFVPVGFEVPVTERSDSNGIPPLVLRDGEILCHGKIDRIDCCDTGEKKLVRVEDYKTGNKIFSPDKLAAGLDMQMLIYLFALRRGGRYAGAESGGVLYMPSGQLNQRNYCDRSPASAEAAEILEDFYRMKGMLLDRAAAHMEPKLAAAAEPVLSADPDSELYLVNDTQMQQIEQLVEQKICDMADSLYAGHVAPKPYLRQDKPPCAYCDYTDICGRSVEDKINYTKAERKEAIAGIFGGQDSQDEEEKK